MNNKEFKEVEEKIYRNNDVSDNSLKLSKDLKNNCIIYLSVLSVILILSIIFIKKVNLLSIISPGWFYSLAIILLAYLIATLLISTIFKKKIKPMANLLYYKIYDTITFILTIIIGFSFVIMFLITPTTVCGQSMNNTLSDGDKVLIWHMGYKATRNDIVVVHVSEKYGQPNSLYIKRIVAQEGDVVSYHDDAMYVGDTIIEKSEYCNLIEFQKCIKLYGEETEAVTEFTVPKGYSIIMGDHRRRNASVDSREFGLVSNKDILGKAFFSIIPFRKISEKNLSYN